MPGFAEESEIEMGIVADLQSRGLFQQASDQRAGREAAQIASKRPIAAYAGFDPTADSLHVGNFVAILGLMYAQSNGIRPDRHRRRRHGPDRRSFGQDLRAAASDQGNRRPERRGHPQGAGAVPRLQPPHRAGHDRQQPRLVRADVGDRLPARCRASTSASARMLAKDSVRARMEASEEGMSYTEFSYQLLQGYDFYRLYKDHDCVLQMGGSDQWGNITAGIDLIRKLEGRERQRLRPDHAADHRFHRARSSARAKATPSG